MADLVFTDDYRQWILSIKTRIQAAQLKAAVAVNRELLELYWYLGEQMLEKQKTAKWGDGFLKQMSQDLLRDFPQIKGFSYRNLKYMRQWVRFWNGSTAIGQQAAAQLENSKGQQLAAQLPENAPQLVTQIPWGHNLVLLDKCQATSEALFYVQKTIQNNWSRAVLTHQIESGLHLREGQSVNNFEATLPKPASDLANQLLRDPYNFDFLTLTEQQRFETGSERIGDLLTQNPNEYIFRFDEDDDHSLSGRATLRPDKTAGGGVCEADTKNLQAAKRRRRGALKCAKSRNRRRVTL